jgi:hypothetical protein
MRVFYTCKGDTRGDCGHNHRRITTAVQCCAADSRGCRKQGGYSDRVVRRTDGRALTEAEKQEINRLEKRP